MIFTIPAGKHRARPIRFGLWWRRTHFSWVVRFDESCKYYLGKVDQLDVNKLVGIGYLSRPRVIVTRYFNRFWFWGLKPMHWTDGARFGWRYSAEKDKIEIMAYCYIDGEQIIDHLADAFIGESYMLKIEVVKTGYWLTVKGPGYTAEKIYRHNHNKRLQYRLGLYFGGNQKAPHQMTVKIEKT